MCLYLCVMVLFFDLFVVQTCRMMMRRSSLTPRTSKAWLSWRRKGDRIRRRITDLREQVRWKVGRRKKGKGRGGRGTLRVKTTMRNISVPGQTTTWTDCGPRGAGRVAFLMHEKVSGKKGVCVALQCSCLM